jgi:hypothetical protein
MTEHIRQFPGLGGNLLTSHISQPFNDQTSPPYIVDVRNHLVSLLDPPM